MVSVAISGGVVMETYFDVLTNILKHMYSTYFNIRVLFNITFNFSKFQMY